MAIIQAVFAFLSRWIGRILNTAFGWATALLFGKVPAGRQTILSLVTLASVIWLVTTLGIAFPSVGTFLLAFVTLPDWVEDNWIRLFMLAASAFLPLVVGIASYFMLAPEDRPRSIGGKVRAVLRGYPYTLGLAITLVMMLVFAPVMKLRSIVRRWSSEHVPVVIEPRDYGAVVRDVQAALERGGLDAERKPASWMLRIPTKVLGFFAGNQIHKLVSDELVVLRSVDQRGNGERTLPTFEVLLHPSDIVISGRPLDAARARAILSEHLTFTRAYLTAAKEAHEIEDRLHAIWRDVIGPPGGVVTDEAIERLRSVELKMRGTELSYEEWEVLFRERLLVERTILRTAAGIENGAQADRGALQSLERRADAA